MTMYKLHTGIIFIIALMMIVVIAEENKEGEASCNPDLNGTDCATHPFEICDSETKKCIHKELFPAEPSEIAGYIILPILFAIASVGGVGGGTIFIPLMIGMFQF